MNPTTQILDITLDTLSAEAQYKYLQERLSRLDKPKKKVKAKPVYRVVIDYYTPG